MIIENSNNERIDKYLSENTEYSRASIAKLIDENKIKVNNSNVKASYKIKDGDTVEILGTIENNFNFEKENMNLDIVYEDDDIIVLNKPSGLIVHPGSGNINHTLINGLLYHADKLSDIGGIERLGIVHRLDKDTSGLMLVAKTNKAHEILADDFKNKRVKREYLALLVGVFPHEMATINAPIGRDEKYRKKMTVTSKNSKEAKSHLKVIKRFKENTLVSFILDTGRTHQIRVHASYIGYPVFNDPVYGVEIIKDFGQFLHSKKIDFFHPISKKEMHFEIEEPKIFKNYVDNLE